MSDNLHVSIKRLKRIPNEQRSLTITALFLYWRLTTAHPNNDNENHYQIKHYNLIRIKGQLMNKFIPAICAITLSLFTTAFTPASYASEEPIQHLKLADVSSYEDAKQIFLNTTADIKSKQKLDAAELQEIHIITYSLEKSVAYFVEHLNGAQQDAAKALAEIVEEVHLDSENNRTAETKAHLESFFEMADRFAKGLK